jgi:predicted MPP superfamily phosphohydrolase
MHFKILHLSDVHFNEARRKDIEFVKQAIINDASVIGTVDLLIFSGDLVQAGGKFDDYALAFDGFLSPIMTSLNVAPSRLFIVPGNHDLDRTEVRRNRVIEQGQNTALANREEVNQFIDDNLRTNWDHLFFRRLASFEDFRRSITEAQSRRDTPFFSTYSVNIQATEVGIACLNSAWRSTGEEAESDYGRLLLGERSLTEALSDIEHCSIKLAVFHHPLAWLKEFDREDCRAILLRHFDVIFTGHNHKTNPEVHATPHGRAIFSEGGALFVSRRYYNGYSILDFSVSERLAQFTLRRYEDDRKVFAPAANVAPEGRFNVTLRAHEDIRQYSEREQSIRAIRRYIEEFLREHMLAPRTETLPSRDIRDLYIPIPLANRSQYKPGLNLTSSIGLVTVSPIAEEIVVQTPQPNIIYGPRESGKTTLGLHLCLLASEENAPTIRTPVYINVDFLKAGTRNIEKSIREFVARSGVTIGNVEEELQKGSLFIVIDNFDRGKLNGRQLRIVKIIEEFIQKFSNNKFVLLCEEREESALVLASEALYSFEPVCYYIQPLSPRTITDLAKRRLESAGIYSQANVNTLLKRMAESHLPRTAYIVSMMLGVFNDDRAVGPINEATLLERFVEAILNRANISDVGRETLDYKIKEVYLSYLAERLSATETFHIDKNELVQWTLDFFRSRSWHFDSTQFVADLLKNGILIQGELEEGETKIGFRYGCLREFFLARRFQSNRNLLDELFHDERFLDHAREIDILTGLTRDEPAIVNMLVSRVNRYADEHNLQMHMRQIETFRVHFGKIRYLSQNNGETQSADAKEELHKSTEEAEKAEGQDDFNALRFIEDMIHDAKSAMGTDLTTKGTETSFLRLFDQLLGSKSTPFLKYFATTMLLSKVIRNNELLNDAELKFRAVNTAIGSWSFFVTVGYGFFEMLVNRSEKIAENEEFIRGFQELSPAEKGKMELFMKVQQNVMMGILAYESIGTDKLRMVFNKCFQETSEENYMKRLILLYVLVDLAFVRGNISQAEAVALVTAFVKQHHSNVWILVLVLSKLGIIYDRPDINQENEHAIERIMADIFLTIQGYGAGARGFTGKLRDEFIRTIRRNKRDRLRKLS